MGAARVEAADPYPLSRRAEGLGYVLTGSLAGALAGPLVEVAGLPFLAVASLAIVAVPLAMIVRLQEPPARVASAAAGPS